jgi:hypothetical protein
MWSSRFPLDIEEMILEKLKILRKHDFERVTRAFAIVFDRSLLKWGTWHKTYPADCRIRAWSGIVTNIGLSDKSLYTIYVFSMANGDALCGSSQREEMVVSVFNQRLFQRTAAPKPKPKQIAMCCETKRWYQFFISGYGGFLRMMKQTSKRHKCKNPGETSEIT